MHRNQLYHDTLICLFLTRGAKTCKKFTLKLIIQKLFRLYNKDIYFDLTKTKAFAYGINKQATFNIDNLTMHSTLNIPI
jgi:hypothetical protein